METAMQELIEYVSNNFPGKFPEGCDKKMAELLEKEKQQIIDAYKTGGNNFDLDKGRPFPYPEDYFTQTYSNGK